MANQIVLNKVGKSDAIFSVIAPASLENGNMVVLGTQNSTSKAYASAAPGAITSLGMVIVASVPLSYDAADAENDYVIATGEIVRAYVPKKGHVMSFPSANFTESEAFAVGVFVIPNAAVTEMESAAALGGTEAVAYIIDEIPTKAGVEMLKIRCIVA